MKTISVLCCLLCAVWTEGSVIHVVGFEQGKVSFQCSHTFAGGNTKYLCRHHCDSSHDILATVKPGTTVSMERITMVDFGNGVFNVTFSHLQLSDSGTYWCAVERFAFDSFITVHLTVIKAVTNEVTTMIPKVSPTWTYENISNSTLATETNLSTVSYSTDRREPITSTGSVLYASVVAAVALGLLVLSWCCFRKCRRHTKPQAQANCEIEEEALPFKTSGIHCPQQKSPPQVSTVAANYSVFPIYENLCPPMSAGGSKNFAANNQDKMNTGDSIYIQPLPYTASDTPGDGSAGKHTNVTTNVTNRPTDLHTSNASARLSEPHNDFTGVMSRSLWFGLDLSEIERLSKV